VIERREHVGNNERLQQQYRAVCDCGYRSRWAVGRWWGDAKAEEHAKACTHTPDLTPGSSGWLRLITASKVAAILGLSPYQSPRSLWHLMRGDIQPEPQTTVQSRGHYLEPAILAWWFDQHPEHGRHERSGKPWISPVLPWAAATPDAVTDGLLPVEAKSAADDAGWGTVGTDEIPVAYAAQCMWTCHVMQAPRIFVPVLTARLEFREYVLEYDPAVAASIEARCKAFLDSLTGETPPDVDAHPETYSALRRLHPNIDGTDVELDPALAGRYALAVLSGKAADEELAVCKSLVLEAMGDAQRANSNGLPVARRQASSSGKPALYAARNLDGLTRRFQEAS
jgi:putative phage-type endonuclease